MFNLHQARKFLFYSLVGLCFTAYPALAQGKKIVETDQTMEVLKNILIGLLILSTVFAFALLLLTTFLITVRFNLSTVLPSLVLPLGLIALTLIGSFCIGEFIPIFAYLMAANGAVTTWVLVLAFVNA